MIADGDLHYDRYLSAGEDEWLMRIGSAEARPILFLPPLFEEMNRTRAFLATIMRNLAAAGFGCWLPDLPGTGESGRPLESCGFHDWQAAARDAASAASRNRPLAIVSMRGGSLLDVSTRASCTWRFAPAEGNSLVRDLVRSSLVAPGTAGEDIVDLAGYRLSASLMDAVKAARPGAPAPLRTVRLASDRGEADRKVEGSPLWRRSEPGNAPELAAILAEDVARWIDRCAAS